MNCAFCNEEMTRKQKGYTKCDHCNYERFVHKGQIIIGIPYNRRWKDIMQDWGTIPEGCLFTLEKWTEEI